MISIRGTVAISIVSLAVAAGCRGSTATPPSDASADRAMDVASELPSPDAMPDVADETRADLAPADAPEDLPSDTAVDAPADVPADARADLGGVDAPDGGCVPVPAPTVRWLNPLPQGNQLQGVWGSSATDVYAVGQHGTILHSSDHGVSWQPQVSGTFETLNAVWGTAANDVYAVGSHGTIIHTADGGRNWTQMSINTPQDLWGVWGPSADDVYAVGTNGTIAHRLARGAWTFRAQVGGSQYPHYHGVYGSGGTVWAVGDRGVVMRSTDGGATWSLATSTDSSSSFYGITGVGGTLYAGAYNFSGTVNVFASTDGGANWTPIRTPGTGGTWGIAAGGGSVYVVGTSGLFATAANGGTTFTSLPSGTTQNLNAVWASDGGELFAVGWTGIILHADSAGATLVQSPAATRETLTKVWASPEGDLIAVGAMGQVLQSNDRGEHFTLRTPATSPLPQLVRALAGLGDEVYASGNGMILRSGDRGVSWTLDRTAPDEVSAVDVNPDGVFAIGRYGFGGDILHKPPGGAWTTISAGSQANFLDIFSIGTEMWIVGGLSRGSGVLHRAGGVFSSVNVDNVGTLTTVGGTSSTSLAAASSDNQIRVSSDRGATWRPASACWLPERSTVLAATASTGLNDVCAGGGRTFIVGGGGTVLVSSDNVNWTSVRTDTFNLLMGCTVDDTGRLIAVGSGGTVLALTFPP